VPASQLPLGMFPFPGGAPGLLSDGLSLYQADAMAKHEKEMEPAVQEEIKRRVRVGATLLFSSANPMPLVGLLGTTGGYLDLAQEYPYLPFAAVEAKYMAQQEKKEANQFARTVMDGVYAYLTKGQNKVLSEEGKANEFKARLEVLSKKYGKGLEE